MWFWDLLTGKIQCPNCGTDGARKSGEQVRCPNPACANFDASLESATPPRGVMSGDLQSGFVPPGSILIQYRNAKGQRKTFCAEGSSLSRTGDHIRVRVAPKGVFITLSRKRILNLPEVDIPLPQSPALEPGRPSARERQILNYHKKYKTTSPRYESLRAKYLNW